MNALLRLLLTTPSQPAQAGLVRAPSAHVRRACACATPQGKAILVKLRYAPGWRLPGGGRSEGEDPRDAVLRELREEIGMTAHGEVRLAAELEEQPDFKHDLASLLVVRDVRYQPRWSWEIEEIMETSLDHFPADLSPRVAAWLEALKDRV